MARPCRESCAAPPGADTVANPQPWHTQLGCTCDILVLPSLAPPQLESRVSHWDVGPVAVVGCARTAAVVGSPVDATLACWAVTRGWEASGIWKSPGLPPPSLISPGCKGGDVGWGRGMVTAGTRPLLSSCNPFLQAVDVIATPSSPSPPVRGAVAPVGCPAVSQPTASAKTPLQCSPAMGVLAPLPSPHAGWHRHLPPVPGSNLKPTPIAPNPSAGPASIPALRPHVPGEPCAVSRSPAPPHSPPHLRPPARGWPQGWEPLRTPEARADPTARPGAGMGPGIATCSSGAASRRTAGLGVLAPIRHGSTHPAQQYPRSCPHRRLHHQPPWLLGGGRGMSPSPSPSRRGQLAVWQ